jgi:chromosome partitioning protein
MKVISCLSRGGGSKTTLSIHLARCLNIYGNDVILIDTDTQGSSYDWSALNQKQAREEQIKVVSITDISLETEIKKFEKYEFVVIDGIPRLQDVAISTIRVSDLILIPVNPSPFDIWASNDLVEVIKERMKKMKNLKAAFVLSRVIPTTKISADIREALKEYGLPVLKTHIKQRVIFPIVASQGLTVFDVKGNSAARLAKKDIEKICDEILDLLSLAEVQRYKE